MDALLRRGFRVSKFKNLSKLAVSRLAMLKNQRQVRSANARFDVIQLLKLGYQDRALLRVEYVIKEQNMLDVFDMIEDFIHLLTERLVLLQDDHKECPDELEEAISSLIFAATRCGEFPELKHMREIFASRFGKDFVTSAAQLRNNCRVNFKMIQRLLTRQPTSEQRLKVLHEIASENGITLHLEEVKPDQKLKHTTSYESAHPYKPQTSDEINNMVVYEDQKETKNSTYEESNSDKTDPKDNSRSEAEIEITLSFSSNDSDKDTKMEPNLHPPIKSEPCSVHESEDEATEIQELPYETLNPIQLKAQAESSDHPRYESSQSFSDISDRKLMSVRTVSVLRS